MKRKLIKFLENNGILDPTRAPLHFPVGAFCAWLTHREIALGITLSFAFLIYETMEDWRIQDRGYKDVWGYLCGFSLCSTLLTLFFA